MYPDTLTLQAVKLVAALNAQSRSITLAESCTGGLLGGLVTSVPGASDVFAQGFVTYSNASKTALLGVEEALLLAHGAVSQPVAEAMAGGALRAAHADIAISITGIAGPGGGSDDKPVGLVYIGCASSSGAICVTKHLLAGDRQAVRIAACQNAVGMALECLT